jgi:hypothetical protein
MSQPVHVTDHAVLRYLERAHGLDVEAIRAHLAGRALTGAQLGAAAVVVDGIKLVLRDTTVVTVIERRWPSRRPT